MSGIFDVWRPTKPEADKPGLVARLTSWWQTWRSKPADRGGNTETGTSATASPAVEQWELWSLRYNRRAIITDIRRNIDEDPRLAKAVRRLSREAVRKGFKVSVRKTARRGPAASRERRAQEILDRTIRDCSLNATRLRSWAWSLPVEGDLFIQIVAQGNQVVDAKRMPAASMERNSDSQDRFLDVTRAFSQLDVQTDQNVAQFALWQIVHQRWNHLDGERYGTSEFLSLRRPARNLQLLEQAQVIRRVTRAALRLLHSVGNKEKPGDEKDIAAYKSRNNLAAQSNQGFDATIAMRDYFGNGLTDVKEIQGDANLDKITDLEYFQDIFAAGLGPPKAILFGGKDINRDILKDQIEQWLRDVQDLTDAIKEILRHILDLALLLEGIDPTTVTYDLAFSVNTTETAAERQDRVSKARQNTIGTGTAAIADPLIPLRVAVSAIAEDYDFEDVDAIVEELKTEARARSIADEPGGQPAPDRPAPKNRTAALSEGKDEESAD